MIIPADSLSKTMRMTQHEWLSRFRAATIEVFQRIQPADQPIVLPKPATSPISAFMYAGASAEAWNDMFNARHTRTTSNNSELNFLKRDARDIGDIIAPKTIIELGSGNAAAVIKKTSEFLRNMPRTENYVSLEMSPDYVLLPAGLIPGLHDVPNILAVQRDFTLPLGKDVINSIEALPNAKKGDILVLSLGSSFCNMPCIPPKGLPGNEKGFPDEEYSALFSEYAKLGQINPKSKVYMYVSYFSGSEEETRAGYADPQTAKWFKSLPFLINRELHPEGFQPRSFRYQCDIDASRDLIIGSLVATKDQKFKITGPDTKPVDIELREGDRIVLNTHYAPKPLKWIYLAAQSGWEAVRLQQNRREGEGPYYGVLFKLNGRQPT